MNIKETIDLIERIVGDDLPLVSITKDEKRTLKEFVKILKNCKIIYWDRTKPSDTPKEWEYE